MRYELRIINGSESNYETIADALDAVLAQYPEAVAYDSSGYLQTYCEPCSEDGRVLVWANKASSVNDDGGKAIAEIVPCLL